MSKPDKQNPTSINRYDYDLVVIGSGPAGIHAAVQASKLKKRVAIVERQNDQLGGAWIHTGTLPSKTLREVLDAIHAIKFHVGHTWVDRIVHELSADDLFGRAKKVALQEQELVRNHLASNNIKTIYGSGYIENDHTVKVTNNGESQNITTDYVLIATGSRPRKPAGIPFDGWRVVDSDEILSHAKLPRRIVIYGAGVIGCEYACIFQSAGTETILVDERSCMLQTLDQEVALGLKKSMETMGVRILLGHKIENLKVENDHITCSINKEQITADTVFFAAGRVSNTEGLGLEKIGINLNDRNAILVNKHFQTSIPNIYAAGDVIGPPALAATSADQGRFAACHAFGTSQGNFPTVFPLGIYTIPELSSVGLSEEDATKQKLDFVVGRASFGEIARGYIRGEQHGILKLIIDRPTQKILGIHVVGDGACNLVHIGMAFMLQGGHAQDLVNMIFNYPTLAEAYRVAAFNALNKIFTNGQIGAPTDSSKKVA